MDIGVFEIGMGGVLSVVSDDLEHGFIYLK